MPFNLDQWKESTRQRLRGWKERMQHAGVNSAYYFLAGVSLLPVTQAVHAGDWGGLAVLGASIGGAVSTNLLANIVQKARDKSEAEIARILEEEVRSAPELKAELDALLEKLSTLQEAEKALSDADKAWFVEAIRGELKNLGSSIKYEAVNIGSGSVAQGPGAVSLGAGATYVGGNYTVQKGPDPRQAEADRADAARRAYLERMRRHCQVLPLAALGGEEGTGDEVTLDDVYIDLDTKIDLKKADLEALRAGQKMAFSDASAAGESQDRPLRLEHREEEEIEPLPLWDAVRATPRVVVLGDPGAGKSTFVRKLLGLQAAVLLGEIRPLEGFAADLFPVLIVLRDLAIGLDHQNLASLPAEAQRQQLLDHLHQYLVRDLKRTTAEASTDLLLQALEGGHVLLVLDGLDEVPQNLRQGVRQLVSALLTEYRIERLLITCRIRSYVGAAVFEKIQTFTIREFDEEKVEAFVQAWYNTQAKKGYIAENDREGRARDLSEAALSENLREISSNPMMLTSMAIIHQKEIGLPRERVRLYKLVVSVLLSRWQKYKHGEDQLVPSASLASFLSDELRLLNAMEHLAYEAHAAGREKESADLPRMTALEILERKEYLGNIGTAEEFLDYADQRSGLLRGNGGELEKPTSYSFPHRTFQEYLAGCYMIRERNPSRGYYQRAVEGDYWSLAAQLGAEELYYNRRAAHTVLDLAYQLMGSDSGAAQDARATLWSALVARIPDPNEIKADMESPHGGEEYLAALPSRLLDLLQSDLTPIERAEAGHLLAGFGDPRQEILSIEKMVFCRVPPGEFVMGEGEESHKVTLPEFFISQYAITNAQFSEFLEAEGYQRSDYWNEAREAGIWNKDGFKGRLDRERRTAPVDLGESFDLENHPVVGISWYEALAFTRWLEERLRALPGFTVSGELNPVRLDSDLHISLPSEAEWEKAARGSDGRRYPWGDDFDVNLANTEESGIGTTSAVGCFPAGISPTGLVDTSGNVWEWTRSIYGRFEKNPPRIIKEYEYPYDGRDGREDLSRSDEFLRVVRGGSFNLASEFARCASRFGFGPGYWDGYYGFRVVVSPFLPS